MKVTVSAGANERAEINDRDEATAAIRYTYFVEANASRDFDMPAGGFLTVGVAEANGDAGEVAALAPAPEPAPVAPVEAAANEPLAAAP